MSTTSSRSSTQRKTRDLVAEELRADILAQHFDADTPLREADLAKRFGTSRGPIRDVLLQLTQEGALVYRANAGVRVSPPPDDETRVFLMKLRREIELDALPRFFEILDDVHRTELLAIRDRIESACTRGDLRDIVASDLALHQYLVRHGGRPGMETVWLTIAVRICMAYSRLEDDHSIFEEHAAIIDPLVAGDLDTALAALRANLI